LVAPVIPIFITSTETFAEVILILAQVDVVAVISVTPILVGVRVFIVKAPTVLPICLTGIEAFFVPIVDCTLQKLRAVVIHVVVLVSAIVRVGRVSVIVICEALQANAITLQLFQVTLLETPVVLPSLVLELLLALSPPTVAV
jgi:hypothetical protein